MSRLCTCNRWRCCLSVESRIQTVQLQTAVNSESKFYWHQFPLDEPGHDWFCGWEKRPNKRLQAYQIAYDLSPIVGRYPRQCPSTTKCAGMVWPLDWEPAEGLWNSQKCYAIYWVRSLWNMVTPFWLELGHLYNTLLKSRIHWLKPSIHWHSSLRKTLGHLKNRPAHNMNCFRTYGRKATRRLIVHGNVTLIQKEHGRTCNCARYLPSIGNPLACPSRAFALHLRCSTEFNGRRCWLWSLSVALIATRSDRSCKVPWHRPDYCVHDVLATTQYHSWLTATICSGLDPPPSKEYTEVYRSLSCNGWHWCTRSWQKSMQLMNLLDATGGVPKIQRQNNKRIMDQILESNMCSAAQIYCLDYCQLFL